MNISVKAQAWDNTVVTLTLPDDRAKEIAEAYKDLPGAYRQDKLHITLAFLGKPPEDKKTAIFEAVRKMAENAPELKVRIGGIAQFIAMPENREKGEHPIVLLVDVPGLNELRTDMVRAIAGAGVKVDDLHGFTAHITIGRGKWGSIPSNIVQGEWTTNWITVNFGSKKMNTPLKMLKAAFTDAVVVSDTEVQFLERVSILRKTGPSEWTLFSRKKGKNGKRKVLGRGTKAEMKKRERQVQFFKHKKGEVIELIRKLEAEVTRETVQRLAKLIQAL